VTFSLLSYAICFSNILSTLGSFSVDGEGRDVCFYLGTKIVNSRLGRTRALNEFSYHLANSPREKVV